MCCWNVEIQNVNEFDKMIFNELTILKKNLLSSIYSRYVNYSLSFLLFLFVFSCSGGEDSSVENTFETNVQNQNNGQTNPPTPVEEIEIQTLCFRPFSTGYHNYNYCDHTNLPHSLLETEKRRVKICVGITI